MALTISDGYVIYKRGEKNPPKTPWWYIHQKAVADAESIQPLYEKEADKGRIAGERLIALGKAEQIKELNLINQATGSNYTDTQDIKLFIQNFNEVLIGKKQFEAAQRRLKSALEKTNQDKSRRAPTIASWFTNALGTALNKNINEFISRNLMDLADQNFETWESSFDDIINKSIQDAFKNLLTKMQEKSGNELYGNEASWREVYQASQQIQGFSQYFQQMIRNKFDFDSIRNILQNNNVKLNNKTHRGIRKIIDSKDGLNLRNERKSRAIGGSVQEFLDSIMTTIGQAAQQATSSGTRVLSSEMAKTDTVTVYSYETQIDTDKLAQDIANQLDESMQFSQSLLDANKIMEDFWNQYLSKLDDTFVIYGSTKAYALTENFSGFHAGGERSLEDAKKIITEAGFDEEKVSKFINAAYNTGEGAILEAQRGEYSEQLEMALSGAIANLLFDDWMTIGKRAGGAQAIHVLQLDTLQIPLSIFLIAAGQALVSASKDSKRLISIKIQLPGKIKYENPITEIKGGSMSEMLEYWNEQAEIAREQSTFSVSFLKNFKQMIMEWIDL